MYTSECYGVVQYYCCLGHPSNDGQQCICKGGVVAFGADFLWVFLSCLSSIVECWSCQQCMNNVCCPSVNLTPFENVLMKLAVPSGMLSIACQSGGLLEKLSEIMHKVFPCDMLALFNY